MPDPIRILLAGRWLYIDPGTGEIVGGAPDVPTIPDDTLLDRIQRTIIPTLLRLARDLPQDMTREKLAALEPPQARALWSLLLRTPIPGVTPNGE